MATLQEIATRASEALDADIWIYFGDLGPQPEQYVSDIYTHKSKETAIFILGTLGGIPDSAFKIGQALKHCYNKVIIAVDGPCKSSGTLLSIVADEIIMSELGEFGPLDIQLRKKEEFNELSSGLIAFQALQTLQSTAVDLMRAVFLDLRTGAQLSTKQALEFASKVAVGALQPIYGQIEPLRLGEQARSMGIGEAYGERLAKGNLKPGALDKLIVGYPSHGFVIDFEEAKELFTNVSRPSTELHEVLIQLRKLPTIRNSIYGNGEPISIKLAPIIAVEPEENNNLDGEIDNEDTGNAEIDTTGAATGEASPEAEPSDATDTATS